jgi:hypothetical protein
MQISSFTLITLAMLAGVGLINILTAVLPALM